MLKKPAFYVIYSITTVVKVEIDIITSTAASLSLAVKYRDILYNHLWPVLARHFADKLYRFQDDNAPVHRTRRRLKSIRENKMADVNEFELLLFAPLKYTR
jgi:hypothetical protein